MNHRIVRTALCSALLAASACEMPRFVGPQVQSPPPGFFMQDGTAAAHLLLPDREVTFHTAWVHTNLSGVSTIYVEGYRGRATIDDAMRAVDIMRDVARDPDTRFGALEALTIDGRQAWGWSESVESVQRGLVEVSYRAMIPYDTVTYTVEFTSGEPSIKLAAPDTLRATVASFAVGKTRWNFPLVAVAIGMLLLLINFWRTRRRTRSAELRTIRLVQVKKPEEELAEAAAAEAAQTKATDEQAPTTPRPPPPVMPSAVS